MNALQEFLRERRAKYGTLQNLATDMRITFSGFLRGVKKGVLSPENCLRLAEVLGEEPPLVFRAAKKHDLANQFERLYGKTVNPMSEEERELVDLWRVLTPGARQNFRALMQDMAPKRMAKRGGRGKQEESSEDTALRKRGRSTS